MFTEYNKTDPNIYRYCSIDKPPPDDQVCGVNVNSFAPCNWENGYGISKSDNIAPCIFMRLKGDPSFHPTYLDDRKLPASMPEDLKFDIKSYARHNATSAVKLRIEIIFGLF